MNYIIVDLANLFFRARHVVQGDIDTKIGMALHVTLASVKKMWNDFKGDHVVFCLEGRSWRKDFYPPYKRNRAVAKQALTEKELEEDKLFWETFDKLKDFLINKTNATVLQHSQLEADDLIAGWINTHLDDQHIIISTDSDFVQLVNTNVKQYNGVMNVLITHEGYFDAKGKQIIDSKTKKPKEINPEWLLFEKCIRGDTTDNVFSAYPKVRKNKLLEAFDDRSKKGFAWNNLMLQRWVDHNGNEHRVLDDYTRNQCLINLSAQPDDIRDIIVSSISENAVTKDIQQVGIKFMKFCGLFDLIKLSEQAKEFADIFNSKYKKTGDIIWPK
jgi:hypothetical protein